MRIMNAHYRPDPLQRLHPLRVALEDFKRAVTNAGLDDRANYLGHGDAYEFEVPPPGNAA